MALPFRAQDLCYRAQRFYDLCGYGYPFSCLAFRANEATVLQFHDVDGRLCVIPLNRRVNASDDEPSNSTVWIPSKRTHREIQSLSLLCGKSLCFCFRK